MVVCYSLVSVAKYTSCTITVSCFSTFHLMYVAYTSTSQPFQPANLCLPSPLPLLLLQDHMDISSVMSFVMVQQARSLLGTYNLNLTLAILVPSLRQLKEAPRDAMIPQQFLAI